MNLAGNKPIRLFAAALAILSLAGSALAAENATLARDTELRDQPFNDAAVVVALKAKTAVSIQARSGAWAQVSVDGQNGYVRLLNLRTASGQKGDSGVKSLAGVFRTGSSGSSVSTGVKGLSEEDLTGAVANPEQVKKLATFAVDKDDASKAAKTAGLKATEIAFLPEPAGKKKKNSEEE